MKKSVFILFVLSSLFVMNSCSNKTTSTDELLAPSNISIILVDEGQVQISWQDNSDNEIKFIIDRKKGIENWIENYHEVSANITSLNDFIPTNSDTIYAYTIRAFDGENYSPFSDTIAWFSQNSAPAELEIEQIAQDSLELIWQDNSVGEQYFRIDRKIDEKGWQTNYAKVAADSTNYIDYANALYDTCNYRLFAISGITNSESAENAFIPFLPAPTNLELQPLTATKINLAWDDNCNNENGFKVFYKRGENAIWDSVTLAANTEEFTDEELEPGVVNYYKICAFYENDNSGFVEDDINTLPAPSALSYIIINPTSIQLHWDDNSNFEEGFLIERKVNEGQWSELSTVSSNVTEYIDDTVNAVENFYYKVCAYFGMNNSSYSNEILYLCPPPSKVILTHHLGDAGDPGSPQITDNNNGIDATDSAENLVYNWMKIQWDNTPLIQDGDISYIEIYRFPDFDTTKISYAGRIEFAPDSSRYIDKFYGVQTVTNKTWSYFIVPYDEAGCFTKSDTVSYKLIDKSTIYSPEPEAEFTTGEEITFDWERISTSTYRLLIFDTTHTLQQSINNIDSTSYTTTPIDMGLPFSGTYLWRLDSFGEAGGGSESDERTIIFTTKK